MATTVTTVPYSTLREVPAVVVPQVVVAQQQPPANANSKKRLAIAQLIIGILTLIGGVAGIAALDLWTTDAGTGIWSGGWIVITGIIGVCSTHSLNLGNLNGVYMAFSIISTCASGLAGLFFIIAVKLCYNYNQEQLNIFEDQKVCNTYLGLGLNIPLLLLMAVEFFVSIIAAVYAGQNCCCRGSQPGVIVQQRVPPLMTVITTSGGQTAYPAAAQMAPQYGGQIAPQYGGQIAPQYGGQMSQPYNPQMLPPHGGQMGVTQPQNTMQSNIGYSERPPQYNAAQY